MQMPISKPSKILDPAISSANSPAICRFSRFLLPPLLLPGYSDVCRDALISFRIEGSRVLRDDAGPWCWDFGGNRGRRGGMRDDAQGGKGGRAEGVWTLNWGLVGCWQEVACFWGGRGGKGWNNMGGMFVCLRGSRRLMARMLIIDDQMRHGRKDTRSSQDIQLSFTSSACLLRSLRPRRNKGLYVCMYSTPTTPLKHKHK
ncbi:hypothetical protein V8E51_003971 [Hyaloscypha variabilis]